MNNVTAPKEYKLSNRSAYYIFALLFLLYFFDYVDRMIVTSLFPFIQKEWGLTDTQSGLLVSMVYWSIVAFVLPVSILVDRWSRKRPSASWLFYGAWPRWPVPSPRPFPSCSRPAAPSGSARPDTLRPARLCCRVYFLRKNGPG